MELPEPLLVTVLRHLSSHELLGSCSSVSKAWRSAAVAALTQVELRLDCQPRAADFSAWMAQHAGMCQLESLRVAAPPGSRLRVQLPPATAAVLALNGADASIDWAAQQRLQQLHVSSVMAGVELLQALAAARLMQLHTLRVERIDWGPLVTPQQRRALADGVRALLASLPQLRHLEASGCDLDDAAGASVRLATQLRSLRLHGNSMRRLPALPPSLTSLAVDLYCHRHEDVSDVCDLTELQGLEIRFALLLQPQRLSQLTRLTKLTLAELSTPGAEGLVAALGQLQQLRHLELEAVTGVGGAPVEVQAVEQALRQLTQLTALCLHDCGVLATQGSGALLTGPSVYSGLQQLTLGGSGMPSSMYNAATMPQFVRCCPALRRLVLMGVWSCEAIESLSGLRHLDDLMVLTEAVLTNEHLKALVAAVDSGRLQALHLAAPRSAVTDAGLLHLTRLSALKHLVMGPLPSISEQLSGAFGGSMEVRIRPRKGKPVVQQLQTHLNASPLCRELKQKELQQELAAAKKEAACERRKAAAAEKRAAAAEKRAAAAGQEVAGLRLQLLGLQAAAEAAAAPSQD